MVNSSIIYEQPSNITSSPDFLISFLDKASGGVWSTVLVGLSFGIPFMALLEYNPRQAFAAASFNALVTVVLLSVFNVVGSFFYILFTLLVGLSLLVNR